MAMMTVKIGVTRMTALRYLGTVLMENLSKQYKLLPKSFSIEQPFSQPDFNLLDGNILTQNRIFWNSISWNIFHNGHTDISHRIFNSFFRCNSGKCIPERYRCDKQQDCDENEDEIHCDYNITKTCATDEYTCDSGACILVGILTSSKLVICTLSF